ncbi:unnamed protein product [Staurois parvus]|uniref:Uncharacterized protein n=1 Tax=Staurois parvus TaxID=386267 RepID=A0ABN9BIR9_9NEOB|nr:unnamed protein product [Staurois parvus]
MNAGSRVRPDIVNAGSRETRYSECRVREYSECGVRGGTGYSECRGPGRAYIVNAGSGETRYSECRVRGHQI